MAVSYLSRTPTVAGNRQIFTYSAWMKRGILGTDQLFFSCSQGSNANKNEFMFTGDQLRLETIISGSSSSVTTTQVFRDPASWYHIVLSVDTTQVTDSSRVRFYVNGTLVTNFSSANYPTQNFNMYYNSTNQHLIGAGNQFAGLVYYDGLMTEIYFVDGLALTPASFGLTDPTTGVWCPLDYSITSGTNSFYLPFTDNSGLNTLGLDRSGNGNNWTLVATTNFNQSTDVPTNTSATRANFCTWNPISSSAPFAITDGNLGIPSTDNKAANGTIGVTTGRWYWEVESIGTTASYMGVTSYAYENNPDVAPTLNSSAPRSVINNTLFKNYTGSAVGNLPNPPANPSGVYGFALDIGAQAVTTLNVDYLIVAGGGGGAGQMGGGGGAGGLLSGNATLNQTSYPIVVGAGGAGGTGAETQGTNGGNSSFNALTATGGGAGGWASTSQSTVLGTAGNAGGSGGGGAAFTNSIGTQSVQGAGTGVSGQGFGGGAVTASSTQNIGYAGGGGGASAAGGTGTNPTVGGAGGAGFTWTINGVTYAGGGGGASGTFSGTGTSTGGAGGAGGGGAGQGYNSSGTTTLPIAGTPNTGGGGGGGGQTAGAAGGSGVVIISYVSATRLAGGGVVTSTGTGATTRWFHQFNSSGTFALGSNSLQYYKDGVLIFTDSTIPSTGVTLFPYIGHTNSGGNSWAIAKTNFGQFPFLYTPPTGFLSINTVNLGVPAIARPNTHMDATLITANQSTNVITNSGSMPPDMVWLKSRTNANNHTLYDSIRGVNTVLYPNLTNAEQTGTAQLTSFNSNGFTLGASENANDEPNELSIGWQWRAGGTAVSNTAGTITSQVSANPTAGFSVVTWTGNATSGATVGHGLTTNADMVIVKNRSTALTNWSVYHSSVGNQYALLLNRTDRQIANINYWNNTNPTSTTFTLGNSTDTNGSGNNMVAYCFARVAGYSAFGSYTGNGSVDGPFIYTGFRPRWVLFKLFAGGTGIENWFILDTARNPFNQMDRLLLPSQNNAESNAYGSYYLDAVSNGFKVRGNYVGFNASGESIIYAAFAESPFQYARAR